MCAESLGKISVPFFSFGTLSTHWCQTLQQMAVINPSAVADSAGADYSCSTTHMRKGLSLEAGDRERSGNLEAN